MRIGRHRITWQWPLRWPISWHVMPKNWACVRPWCKREGKRMALGQSRDGCCPDCGDPLRRIAGP